MTTTPLMNHDALDLQRLKAEVGLGPSISTSQPLPAAPIELPEVWTRENTYTSRHLQTEDMSPWPLVLDDGDAAHPITQRYRLTPAAIEGLYRELQPGGGWEYLDAWREPMQDMVTLGRGLEPCKVCGGAGRYPRRLQGKASGIVRVVPQLCCCSMARTFYARWDRLVPEHFRDCSLWDMRPIDTAQEAAIATLRSNPDRSYYLYGGSGKGKTYLSWALAYRQVLAQVWADERWPLPPDLTPTQVWAIHTMTWLDQDQAWSLHTPGDGTPIPDVTAEMIRAARRVHHRRPVLLLSEVDRFPVTPRRIERLIQLVDAVYETDGQIIATSNLSVDQLRTRWSTSENASVLVRRIAEAGTAIEF